MERKRVTLDHPSLRRSVRIAQPAHPDEHYAANRLKRRLFADDVILKPILEAKVATPTQSVEQASRPIIESFMAVTEQVQRAVAKPFQQPALSMDAAETMEFPEASFSPSSLSFAAYEPEDIDMSLEESAYPTEERRNIKTKIFTIAAIVIFVTGAFTAVAGYMVNNKVSKSINDLEINQVSSGVSANTVIQANEGLVDKAALMAYKVPDDEPRILRITSLGITTRIESLSTALDGTIDVPKNSYDAGWYNQSAKPEAAKGASLITGYSTADDKQAVFYNLKNLVAGDIIEVELGSGTIIKYKMVDRQVYPLKEVDLARALTAVNRDKPGLNLLTLSDSDDSKNPENSQIILIQAEKVN